MFSFELTQFFSLNIYCSKQDYFCIQKLYSIFDFYNTDWIEYISNYHSVLKCLSPTVSLQNSQSYALPTLRATKSQNSVFISLVYNQAKLVENEYHSPGLPAYSQECAYLDWIVTSMDTLQTRNGWIKMH